MKNLGYIAGEITKGKNLSENLLKYGNGMCSMYNGLGFIKMSMNYYTVLDIARDLQNDKDLLNMINILNELVERFVENDECDDYVTLIIILTYERVPDNHFRSTFD